MKPATRIHLGFMLFLVVAISAVFLPQVAAGGRSGLASGATVAVVVFGLAIVAAVIGVALLVMTIRNRASIDAGTRLAGFLPLGILAAGVIVVVFLIRQKQREHQQDQPPPRQLAPTAPP
jgi:NADH:ubiquinone oxidoreductase subunit K